MDGFSSGPFLYLITDRRLCGDKGLAASVEEAVNAGVDVVQLREKDLPAAELLDAALKLRAVTSRFGAKLIVNGRLDVALASGADGVHLGQADFSAKDARPFLSKGMLIGVSTHSQAQAKRACDDGADYITFGPVCYTASKAAYGPPVGFDELKKTAASVSIPVFALGGIKEAVVKDALGAGAVGIAVISAILGAKDIGASVKGLKRSMNRKEQS